MRCNSVIPLFCCALLRSWWSWKSLWKFDIASYLQKLSPLLYQYPVFLFIKLCVWMMPLLTFVLFEAAVFGIFTNSGPCVCIKSSIKFPLNGWKDQVWPGLRGDLCLADIAHARARTYTGWKPRGNVWRIGFGPITLLADAIPRDFTASAPVLAEWELLFSFFPAGARSGVRLWFPATHQMTIVTVSSLLLLLLY